MITKFGVIRAFAGVSQADVADDLDVRLDTVQSWERGKRRAPPRVIERVFDIGLEMQSIGKMFADAFPGGDWSILAPQDDERARELGFPSVHAWKSCAAAAIFASGDGFEIVQESELGVDGVRAFSFYVRRDAEGELIEPFPHLRQVAQILAWDRRAAADLRSMLGELIDTLGGDTRRLGEVVPLSAIPTCEPPEAHSQIRGLIIAVDQSGEAVTSYCLHLLE